MSGCFGTAPATPDPILEGVGDSLFTTGDRYAYTVSVPRMYNIVGREGVKALWSEKWQEAWKPTGSNKLRGLLRKKIKKQKNGRKRSGNMILLGGPHFTGLGL